MASGFFSVEETKSKTRPSGNKAFSCASCGLYKDIKSPRMAPFGDFEKQIISTDQIGEFRYQNLSSDSSFFTLVSGNNTIVATGQMELNIKYRNKYLF